MTTEGGRGCSCFCSSAPSLSVPLLVVLQAMSAPKDVALQEKAFSSLLPNIEVIKGFFDLSNAMTTELPKLLQVGRLTPHPAYATHPTAC